MPLYLVNSSYKVVFSRPGYKLVIAFYVHFQCPLLAQIKVLLSSSLAVADQQVP